MMAIVFCHWLRQLAIMSFVRFMFYEFVDCMCVGSCVILTRISWQIARDRASDFFELPPVLHHSFGVQLHAIYS